MAQRLSVALAAHANTPAGLRRPIDFTLERTAVGLLLNYAISGADGLHIPPPVAPAPADALWRTTCCELFVAPVGGSAYREFNFSPSGQWAAYDFATYRNKTANVPLESPPEIHSRLDAHLLRVTVALPTSALPDGTAWNIGVSAVLESAEGMFGYHALAHAPGRPDFHWHGGFILRLEDD